ncbi:organic cation/carnitine transporter 7-like protein, partial [Tanacetum coccineum]
MAEQGPPGYTVDEALVAIGYGKFQISVFLYAVLRSVAEAMELMLLTYIGLAVEADFQLTSSEKNLISIVTFVGIILGAWLWSAVSDSFGRKPGFLGSTIVKTLARLISCVAPNYVTLLMLRFVVGLGLGGARVFNTWFMEFVPTLKRGTWMIAFFVSCSIGTSAKSLLAWGIVEWYGWRLLLGVSSLPSLLALLFYTKVPESPRFLYAKGELGEASRILNWGAELNKRLLPEGELISAHTDESTHNVQPSIRHNNTHELLRITSITQLRQTIARLLIPVWLRLAALSENLITSMVERKSQFAQLFSPAWLRTTALLLILFFANTYSYYGIIHLTSELKVGNITDPKFYKDVFIISLAELPGLGLAYVMMETLGRKLSMAIMLDWGFIVISIQAMDQQTITMTTVFVTRMLMSGSFAVIQIYSDEIYPTQLRTLGVGVAIAVGRVGSIVLPLVGEGISDDGHKTPALIMFAFKISVSVVCALLLPTETRGRVLEDDD